MLEVLEIVKVIGVLETKSPKELVITPLTKYGTLAIFYTSCSYRTIYQQS